MQAKVLIATEEPRAFHLGGHLLILLAMSIANESVVSRTEHVLMRVAFPERSSPVSLVWETQIGSGESHGGEIPELGLVDLCRHPPY